jgi:hypothetical protein
MTTQPITLQLSEPILRYLQQIAAATNRSVEQVVRQSVEGNLPPSVTSMPVEMQGELLAMQDYPVEQLRLIAASQVPSNEEERHLHLLDKIMTETLTTAEREELAALRFAADRLMLRKAYAWAVLRWRGYPIPSLHQIPFN